MPARSIQVAAPLLVLGFALLASGCGETLDPDYKPVTGLVTLDGKPLADAQVTFLPDGEGSSGSGFTDENGQYTLYYAARRPGAKLGENRVVITKSRQPDRKAGERYFNEIQAELLPQKYNRKSDLTATVENKRNEIDFELKSK